MPPAERIRRPPPDARLLPSHLTFLADVILPRHLHRVFTYRVPPHLHDEVKVGSQVRVPFGATDLVGLVATIMSGSDAGLRHQPSAFRLRDIHAVVDDEQTGIPPDLLVVARLVSDYYVAPQGQTIRLILPPQGSTATRYALTESGLRVGEDAEKLTALSSIAQRLLLRLGRRPHGLTLATLRKTVDRGISRPLSMLRRQGFVEARDDAPGKRPSDQAIPSLPAAPLGPHIEGSSGEETVWWQQIVNALEAGHAERFLLMAQPEARRPRMLHAIDAVLTRQRQTLIVAPDIATVEAMGIAVREQWGARAVVFHGGLTPAVRRERWHRIRSGSVSIVVGTRSAVFAPLTNIGLIWIDDEEDAALKEETEPHYHAREVAWMRAGMHRAVLVLGSGQPSVETRYRHPTPEDGARHGMPPSALRLASRSSPVIDTIDLRALPFGTLLSETMASGIVAAVGARMPAILFLNRKGFAPALLCRECGNTPQCGHCSVSLTFYKREGRLSCHYCGTTLPLPDTCPRCHAPKLEPRGIGTEAVEERVRRLVPRARIGRIDRDTCRIPKHATELRRRFIDGELDILIGTQMLLQGASLPPVGFVGLVQADAGLHLPDFRAGEQTYRTLSQAAELCGDQEHGGRVVLQTFLPTHYVIEAVRTQNPAHFYDQELAFRRALAYPPFSHLISLHITGTSDARAQAAAERWAAELKKLATRSGSVVWGPIPSPISRLRDRYRWQIVLKSEDAQATR
ncbi:MAG TPA: primosomal protein N', partial [Nitrospiraceae bacterium]|nr:primosomal protein N' [Nitrospiraceae bacterium]